MSWLSDLFSGDRSSPSRGGRDGQALASLERALQLCRGIAAAGAAVHEEHADLAGRAVEAANSLSARLESLREETSATVPGTVASSAGVQVSGAGEEGDEPAHLPGEELREVVERLEPVHFGLVRLEVQRETPESTGLPADLSRLETLVDRLVEEGTDAAAG